MKNEELKQFILSLVPEAVFDEGKHFLSVNIPSEKIYFLSENLKNNSALSFDYLFCLTGVDWLSFFSVVYHLTSTSLGHSLVIKAKIQNYENPAIDTVCNFWRTAEFHEREIYDLFGIQFNNHPNLRRILLEDDWAGFPLRKNYVDDVNIVDLE